ncbi:hypothetical protein NPIL_354641 [Nephila pilipes]|uniref:Uncharacterized protein n=1 Tax=Nephila pilipes TaxID=299642 RepID=A0A8X6TQ74_NEPPI|nr:hypothetical protein NPIL_354641 [Nephila pilipes]
MLNQRIPPTPTKAIIRSEINATVSFAKPDSSSTKRSLRHRQVLRNKRSISPPIYRIECSSICFIYNRNGKVNSVGSSQTDKF